VCREIAGTIDLFPTLCGLAGAATPQDRVIDGKDILPLLTTPGAKSPHEALFAMGGPELKVVRSGPWKLHVKNPGSSSALDVRGDDWIDPRGPDGLTIIAQAEQAMPSRHPGLESGAPPKPMMLFDVVEDPGEQHDVAAKHPEVVARLKALFDEMEAQVPPIAPAVITPGPRGIRRLPGGALRYELPLRSRP
jgi:arylsulfatase A-like enzyme